MHLNRIVAVVSVIISLFLAVLPVLANFDWTSTAGVLAGIIAILSVTQKWLDGWQKHEEREATETDTFPPPDEGDPGIKAIEE